MSMTDEQILGRPVGWWLKEADIRLNGAFDRALEGSDVGRRGWQVLSSLSKRSVSRTELVAMLKSFDSPEAIHGVVVDLERHGWVDEEDGLLRLTPSGAQTQTGAVGTSASRRTPTSASSGFSPDSQKRCNRQR